MAATTSPASTKSSTDQTDDDDDTNEDDTHLSFLTLGDGDFTWSLDLARYLAKSSLYHHHHCRFVATGIDSVEELNAKYRHTPFVQREWQRLNQQQQQQQQQQTNTHYTTTTTKPTKSQWQLEMRHDVNAIVVPGHKDHHGTNDIRADVVIFNHPHLGMEHATRHAHFLSHLFHSVAHHWWRRRRRRRQNLFYLTLVQGQFERWQCLDAAHRHDMVLAHETSKLIFCPRPAGIEFQHDGVTTNQPSLSSTTKSVYQHYYEHRRHQTGKSFASRANGSETYVFCHRDDHRSDSPLPMELPWFVVPDDTSNAVTDETTTTTSTTSKPTTSVVSLFVCTECDKSFREERSLTNHIKSKHTCDASDGRKRQRHATDEPTLLHHTCRYCQSNASPTTMTRTFDSREALQDHITAKHTAIHTSLSPDEKLVRTELVLRVVTEHGTEDHSYQCLYGKCDICGHVYTDVLDRTNHWNAFVPSQSNGSASTSSKAVELQCQFCRKAFRQTRALFQHENFCSNRREGSAREKDVVKPTRGVC